MKPIPTLYKPLKSVDIDTKSHFQQVSNAPIAVQFQPQVSWQKRLLLGS